MLRYWREIVLAKYGRIIACKSTSFLLQGGQERSRQSSLAVITVEGGLDSKFPYVKSDLSLCIINIQFPFKQDQKHLLQDRESSKLNQSDP